MSETEQYQPTVKVRMSRSLWRALNRSLRFDDRARSFGDLQRQDPNGARLALVQAFAGTMKANYETPKAYRASDHRPLVLGRMSLSFARAAVHPNAVIDRVEVVRPQRWDGLKRLVGKPAVEEVVARVDWTVSEMYQFVDPTWVAEADETNQ